jgi:predicted house-cleaning noncanonical NTP pyrophosphatase (MazG superfamily)
MDNEHDHDDKGSCLACECEGLQTGDSEPEVIDSIKELRKNKEMKANTFHIKRAQFENSTNEQIEAWFHRFFEVIIDDSDKPYIVKYENKKEATVYYTKKILKNLNKRNLDRCIGQINQMTDMISEFGNQINTNTEVLTSKKKRKPKKKGGGFF